MLGHDCYTFDQAHEVLVAVTPKVFGRTPNLNFVIGNVVHHVSLRPKREGLRIVQMCGKVCSEQQPQGNNCIEKLVHRLFASKYHKGFG